MRPELMARDAGQPVEDGSTAPGLVALRHVRETARPLVLRSGIQEYPVGVWGTCFGVGYGNRVFVVSAAHLTHTNHSEDLMVAAANDLRHSFKLGAGVVVSPPDDPDGVDVIVYPSGFAGLDNGTLARARIINLQDSVTAWQPSAYVSDFWVIGFPRDLNEVDYGRHVVQTAQAVLPGRYEGVMRVQGHVHRLKVGNPHDLREFAGFSGGPVFSLEYQVAANPLLHFCGVAVAGSAVSGFVHFVDANAVRFVLNTAIEHLNGGISFRGPPPEDL